MDFTCSVRCALIPAAFAIAAVGCGRTPPYVRPAPRACVVGRRAPAGVAEPPLPTRIGPCGPYAILASGRQTLRRIADRCDGSLLVASRDGRSAAQSMIVVDEGGRVIARHAWAADAIIGTPDGFAAVTSRGGASTLVALDPTGVEVSPPVFDAHPLPDEVLGLAVDAAGTVAVLSPSELRIHPLGGSARVALRMSSSRARASVVRAAPEMQTGFRLFDLGDNAPRMATGWNVRWIEDDGFVDAPRPLFPALDVAREGLVLRDVTLVSDDRALVVAQGVPPDPLAGRVVARFESVVPGAREAPLSLGPTNNLVEIGLSVRLARGFTDTLVAWTNADPRWPSNHDAVYAARVSDNGRATTTRCLDRDTLLGYAYGWRGRGGFGVIWTAYAPPVPNSGLIVGEGEQRVVWWPDGA
jgi:hypothetical protein